jgi:hypothetical protein
VPHIILKENQMPKKTVIVGLGGTGDWVLTFLKSRLYAAYGEAEVKRDVQFLLVDTIHPKTRETAFDSDDRKFQVRSVLDQHEEQVAHLGGVRVEQHEYLALTGEIHQVAESIRRGQDAHTRHLNWFTADYYLRSLPAAAMNITDGAGQWRQFGRIALVLSAERGEFVQRVQRLIRAADVPAGDTLMVYLVASTAGGTGAGTFLDAAALIRAAAEEAGKKVWIVGFFVLPSAFRNVLGERTMEATVTRAFATFRELVRFQTQAGQNVPFTIRYSLSKAVEVRDKLFDTVFLFDANTERLNLADAKPWSGISPSIADSLEVFIDRTAGSVILQDLINASARMSSEVRMAGTLPAQFHSMGSHKIVLPARQYATMFASRFVMDLMERLFPTRDDGGIPRPARAERTDAEYRQSALQFMRKIPSLFTQVVDLLPDQPDGLKKLRAFSARSLDDYRAFLRPKDQPQGADLNVLTENPLGDVQTGKEMGDSAEDAARRLVRDATRRADAYFEKVGRVLEAVVGQLEREISTEVHHQVREILNGRIAELPRPAVGTALAFLAQVEAACDDLELEVLRAAEMAIDAQRGGQNSLGYWKSEVDLAQSAMEATRGYDGILNRRRAYDAQRAYLDVQAAYLDRRRMREIFEAYRRIVGALKRRSAALSQALRGWADTALLSDQFSAYQEGKSDIAEIETGLRQAGQTFSSSYGLSAHQEDRSVDIHMNGYFDALYDRVARPQLDEWVGAVEWEMRPPASGDRASAGEREVVLNVSPPGGEMLVLRATSGKELYQQVFDRVRQIIAPRVTGLSIFDYFLHARLTPQQVADFLYEHTAPLIGRLIPAQGGDPARQVHLLTQQPSSSDGVAFLEQLRIDLRNRLDGVDLQDGRQPDFDNPYTLTLLYLVQDIREGQVAVMADYEERYNRQLTQSDAYVINHVFRCEQEAARIEKAFLDERGSQGQGGWKRIHARVCRLLDRPARLRVFLQLLALDLIQLVPEPEEKTTRVWMILPGGDPAESTGARVVWLTAPVRGEEDRGVPVSLSLLLGMERFCFTGASARPGGEIPIDYEALERTLRARRNAIIDGEPGGPGGEDLGTRYEAYLAEGLGRHLELARRVHTVEEVEDLGIIARFYLEEEIRKLESLAV